MVCTIRSDTRVKKSPRELYTEKGIISNEQQVALYLGPSGDIREFLKKFYEEKCDVTEMMPRHFYFVDFVQNRMVKDMHRKRNISLLREIIPYMRFTGSSLERFIKSAPFDLLVLYRRSNYIPRRNRNLLATRLG